MQKLTVKKLVDFRNRTDRGKLTYVMRLNQAVNPDATPKGEGGDYWVTSISSLISSFKANDISGAHDKVVELEKKRSKTKLKQTRDMYARNINILEQFSATDFKKWRPSKVLEFPKTPKRKIVFSVKGFDVQVDISHIFTFKKDGFDQVGGTWFVAKLNGFKQTDLGMFSSLMHKYLTAHFADTHKISPEYCIAVDVFSKTDVNYAQLVNKQVADLLEVTLDDIRSYQRSLSSKTAIPTNPNLKQTPGQRPSK